MADWSSILIWWITRTDFDQDILSIKKLRYVDFLYHYVCLEEEKKEYIEGPTLVYLKDVVIHATIISE